MTELNLSVPVTAAKMDKASLKKLGKLFGVKDLMIQDISVYDIIDKEIAKGSENIKIDRRINEVNERKYLKESYSLFRLELSNYLANSEKVYAEVERIIQHKKMDTASKKNAIQKLLYRLADRELYSKFKQIGGSLDFVHVYSKKPNLESYEISNNRNLCKIHKDVKMCNKSKNCHMYRGKCLLSLGKNMLVKFISKVSDELLEEDFKSKELMRKDGYYVSDIVDYKVFTRREQQRIIRSEHYNINKLLGEIFGEENIPKIGKRGEGKMNKDINEENMRNPLTELGDMYVQKVIPNNNTIYRAYSNGYYWIKNKFYDTTYRNMGYYSILQTDLSNYLRSGVIDWLNAKENRKYIKNELMQHFSVYGGGVDEFIKTFTVHTSRNSDNSSNYIIELSVLSKIQPIPILVFDNYNKLIYVYNDGLRYSKLGKTGDKSLVKKYSDLKDRVDLINLKFIFTGNKDVPGEVHVLYYK